jgi:hypothetical protein
LGTVSDNNFFFIKTKNYDEQLEEFIATNLIKMLTNSNFYRQDVIIFAKQIRMLTTKIDQNLKLNLILFALNKLII